MMELTLEKTSWIHLCIDMQRMFAEKTPWQVPWMAKVSPQIHEIVGRHASRTIFTRFVPPRRAREMPGMWRHYYEKWEMMTLDQRGPDMVDLVPTLRAMVSPARIFDKMTYSPWINGELHRALTKEGVDTIVMSGGETDVCVLAAVLGAIDHGYRVVLLKDAVCSGTDGTHDASLEVLHDRFSVQVEFMQTEQFLSKAG
ncbi:MULTISPECIES: cysteine hydrolase family protein [Rhizobium]|nr:cysteine hydrolase [Rhizobium rosettiformans]